MADYDVYAAEFAQLKHGYALWSPEPCGYDEVQIGDVGYILEGGFHRLFNATLAADHPSNAKLGVPADFSRLLISNPEWMWQHQGVFGVGDVALKTKHVSRIGLHDSSDGPLPIGGRMQFICENNHGAVLCLKQRTIREETYLLDSFKEYTLRNFRSWYQFTLGLGRRLENGQIMLVTGCDKTSEWAMAAFTNRAKRATISFVSGTSVVSSGFTLSADWENTSDAIYKMGPYRTSQIVSNDQAVFIRGYRVRERPLLAPKVLKAAAEPQPPGPRDGEFGPTSLYCETRNMDGSLVENPRLQEQGNGEESRTPDYSMDSEVLLESIPNNRPAFHPADALLEYIFEHSDKPVAIVHDDDWCSTKCDFRADSASEPLSSEAVDSIIEAFRETFFKDSSERHNSSSSEVSANSPPSTTIQPQNEAVFFDSPGTRSIPNPRAIALRSPQTSRLGGCWTCRIRRKKCDEHRIGDSCTTCLRLKIKCLGWGSRRPEWMRDKQAIQKYKADIKAQITRTGAGVIRGQRRSSLVKSPASFPSQSHATSSSTSSVACDGFSPSQYLQQRLPFPMISLVPRGFNDSDESGLQSDDSLTNLECEVDSTTLAQRVHLPQFSSLRQHLLGISPSESIPTLTQSPVLQPIPYYFEHVRKIQFIFAGNSIANVTYSLIECDPEGAVTHAICALANFHFTHTRVAQGLEAPNQEHSVAKFFFDQALVRFARVKQLKRSYSESHAIAALHLVSLSLFSHGTTDWQGPLGIALEWLARTGLVQDVDPKEALLNMSHAGQCAVKITMWMDIFASLSVSRAPTFILLYRKLLTKDHSDGDLHMERLTGIPNEVLLALVEVSGLEHWKAQQGTLGVQGLSTLSVQGLIRWGDEIECQLHQHSANQTSVAEADQEPLHPYLLSIGTTDAAQSSMPHGIPSAHGVESAATFPGEEMRSIVASIFRETAMLYLHTIVSAPNPEITASIETISQLLNLLEPSEVDRALVFPIFLAGSLADDPNHREMFKARLQAQDENVGNSQPTRAVMEMVWQRRDYDGLPVEWREVIKESGTNLLLM